MALAPLTATALQEPTAGILGASWPPNPEEPDVQHLNCDGPGHWFATVLPPQSLAQRQLSPPEHGALVQHLISAASTGQPPLMVVPPEAEQALVETQTPMWTTLVSKQTNRPRSVC
jgi:hypothetical protein